MADSRKIKGEVRITKERRAQAKVEHALQYKEKIKEFVGTPTTELLAIILAGAVSLNASDIHLEPEEEGVKIRIRMDGILQDVLTLDPKIFKGLLSRIKLLSELKLNISDRPQDGRFSIFIEGGSASPSQERPTLPAGRKEGGFGIETRVSALPSEHGESIVIRILDPESLRGLSKLGLRPDLLEIVKKALKQPNGMILATGPTGCGKTTTLYAFCKEINSPEIKVVTIEDPIEYHLEGISQTQVNPKKGYRFASGLRAIVRQDPDVILVGEMRDEETVSIALQAALTGHLVFSTLHTNDAAGAVTRLISLKGDLANIGPALNVVIGQRLLRKACEKCGEKRSVAKKELAKIETELGPIKERFSIPKLNSGLKVLKVKGCEACNFTGYRGRTGIFEIFPIDDEMEAFILKEPAIVELKQKAMQRGMTTMKQDGFLKVVQKITTIEEVERVMGE